MGLYSGGLIIGRIFASGISGAFFQESLFIFYLFTFWGGGRGGGAYYWKFKVFLVTL